MKKIMFLVATQKGFEVLKEVYSKRPESIGLISTFHEVNIRDSFSERIEQFCLSKGIPFVKWKDLKGELVQYITDYKITNLVTIAWRYLLPLEINKHLESNFIIFHDSLLPRYRGFAPTPTAVMCGDDEIGMSVIFSHENVDSGPIIIQKKISNCSNKYIDEIIALQSELFKEAIIELIDMINSGNVKGVPQDDALATYSAWRDPEDCRIDWGLSSIDIFNLIRAVGYPYPGAYTYVDDTKLYIWKAEVVDEMPFAIRYPGKLWSFDLNGNPIVTCGKGMLKLTHYTNENMEKYEFKHLRKKLK